MLTRDDFERRYAAMPEVKKAELIQGVVYMGSPVRYRQHGPPEHALAAWLAFYESHTPGFLAAHNTTLRLDLDNESQPDLLLRLPEVAGGATRVTVDGYLTGAPELVIDVAASSTSCDLRQKLEFPGLCLDVAALLGEGIPALRRTIDRSVGTPEHAEFVRRLANPAG